MKTFILSVLLSLVAIPKIAYSAETPPIVGNPFPNGGLDIDCDEGFNIFSNGINAQISALRAKYLLPANTAAERLAILQQIQALELQLLQARMYCTAVRRTTIPSGLTQAQYCAMLGAEIQYAFVNVLNGMIANQCVVLDANGKPGTPITFKSPPSNICNQYFVAYYTWVGIINQQAASVCGTAGLGNYQPWMPGYVPPAPVQTGPVAPPRTGGLAPLGSPIPVTGYPGIPVTPR